MLRQYLNARLQGDVENARTLWDPKDLRRTGAMGIRYQAVLASFDDYWFLDAEAHRELAQQVVPVLRDSVTAEDSALFTVLLKDRKSGAVRDTLRYSVQKDAGNWVVALPYLQSTRAWTRREGRFTRLRAKKLSSVSTHALQSLDDAIARIFQELGTPEATQLRLERIKLDYFACETDDDVRMLLGSARRAGYLPGGERVVTRFFPDIRAAACLAVNLTLREPPLRNVPLFEAGLPAALGGDDQLGAEVVVQRARDTALRDRSALESPFGSGKPASPEAVPMAALWCKALLQEMQPAGFLALARSLGGTSKQVAVHSAADVKSALEKATGKKWPALVDAVLQRAREIEPPLRPGCASWPGDTHGLQPFLRWRDTDENWGLLGFETGPDYTLTIAPHDPAPPKWMRNMVDSLAAVHGGEGPEWELREVVRPVGDPPRLYMLVRAKLDEDLEPYESTLYPQHFLTRNYKNDLFGLFVTPDEVRLYDYTQNKVVAEYSTKTSPPGGLVYYDETPGHICFRFRQNLIPRPLTAYYVELSAYTGE